MRQRMRELFTIYFVCLLRRLLRSRRREIAWHGILRVRLLDRTFVPGNSQPGIKRSREQNPLQFLLWLEDAVLVAIAV